MKRWNAVNQAIQLSWTMLLALLLPLLAGVWIDKWLGSSPWGVLIGMAVGILTATIGVARMTIRMFYPDTGAEPERQETEARDEEGPE